MSFVGSDDHPVSITIDIPFHSPRHASIALQALRVDPELSTLVRRTLSTVTRAKTAHAPSGDKELREETVLRALYCARTNRTLRVAVNSFMDSVVLVLEVLAELDVETVKRELMSGNVGTDSKVGIAS